jgi:hypothetical protein
MERSGHPRRQCLRASGNAGPPSGTGTWKGVHTLKSRNGFEYTVFVRLLPALLSRAISLLCAAHPLRYDRAWPLGLNHRKLDQVCSCICGQNGRYFPNNLENYHISALLGGPWLHQVPRATPSLTKIVWPATNKSYRSNTRRDACG